MFTKFYDFSFFSFISLHIILPSFNYISMSTDEWSGGWPNQGVVGGGEQPSVAPVTLQKSIQDLG